MGIFVTLLLFTVGIVLIVKGGDIFVDAASWIARVSGIPKFIVGATIVSLATTLPEIIVSLIAAAEGKVDMAIGNAVGSVTANTGLIMSITLIAVSVAAPRGKYLFKSALLIVVAATLFAASFGGSFAPWGSVLLFALFVLFIVENIREAKKDNGLGEDSPKPERKEAALNVAKFLIGAAGIVIGSRLLVDNGSEIASLLNVPESIIAVTMVAIGTSLPELVTTIASIAKKQASLSIGNILGANIIDLALILPLSSLVSGKNLPISAQTINFDMPACLLLVLVALVPSIVRQKFYRWQGVLMIALYCGYLALIL